jgi:hypothetical protein
VERAWHALLVWDEYLLDLDGCGLAGLRLRLGDNLYLVDLDRCELGLKHSRDELFPPFGGHWRDKWCACGQVSSRNGLLFQQVWTGNVRKPADYAVDHSHFFAPISLECVTWVGHPTRLTGIGLRQPE